MAIVEKKIGKVDAIFYRGGLRGNFNKIDEKTYIDYKNFIKQNCNYFNFDFIDMNECFSNSNLDKKWLFIDRSHLTDLGNEYLAEFISSKLS